MIQLQSSGSHRRYFINERLCSEMPSPLRFSLFPSLSQPSSLLLIATLPSPLLICSLIFFLLQSAVAPPPPSPSFGLPHLIPLMCFFSFFFFFFHSPKLLQRIEEDSNTRHMHEGLHLFTLLAHSPHHICEHALASELCTESD